jgi:hypothetical protein
MNRAVVRPDSVVGSPWGASLQQRIAFDRRDVTAIEVGKVDLALTLGLGLVLLLAFHVLGLLLLHFFWTGT